MKSIKVKPLFANYWNLPSIENYTSMEKSQSRRPTMSVATMEGVIVILYTYNRLTALYLCIIYSPPGASEVPSEMLVA